MSIELNISFKEEEGITREFHIYIYIIARHTCNNQAGMAELQMEMLAMGVIKKRINNVPNHCNAEKKKQI